MAQSEASVECAVQRLTPINSSETRLCAMFVGWVIAFYGVCRRDWPGTITVLAGLGLAVGAMTIGELNSNDSV